MAIWTVARQYIKGKWFPNLLNPTNGGIQGFLDAIKDNPDRLFAPISQEQALKVATLRACLQIRSETIGALPVHMIEKRTNARVYDHPLLNILEYGPNSYLNKMAFESMSIANTDLHGNHLSIIVRKQRDKTPMAINPVPEETGFEIFQDPNTGIGQYRIAGQVYAFNDVLHFTNLSLNGITGTSVLRAAQPTLATQIEGDMATFRAMKQGLKIGGFFTGSETLTDEQFAQFKQRMAMYTSPDSQSMWMPLPKGMAPVTTGNFKISPVDAQLLNSRAFGIEELCRYFGVAPALIGHADKASSWASSLEQLNLHFRTYTVIPMLRRREQTMEMRLLSSADRANFKIRYDINALNAMDMAGQATADSLNLNSGKANINELRARDGQPGIGPAGDIHRVPMNLGPASVKPPAQTSITKPESNNVSV